MRNTYKLTLLLSGTATLALLTWGCKTAAPPPSGFLSGGYSNLKQVDNSTWRYVDTNRLAAYRSFRVEPVSVLVKEYWGTTFTAGQQAAVGAQFRQKIVNALASRSDVTGTPGPNTAEVRAAITQAYRVGNSLAMGVEAEILDPQTHQQLAAIRGVRIGPPEVGLRLNAYNLDNSGYTPAWWSWPSAIQLMDEWAEQVRKMVDEAHKR